MLRPAPIRLVVLQPVLVRLVLLSFALLHSFLSSASADEYRTQCLNFEPPLNGGYCVHRPTTRPSRDLVYYLHGSGADQYRWQSDFGLGRAVRDEWQRRARRLPTVVSVSFGPFWLLAEQNASPRSGLFELFTGQIMPRVESDLRWRAGRRMILGESMGGFNTAQLALKTRNFVKAAVLCTPMSPVSIFASDHEIRAFVESSKAYGYHREVNPRLVPETVAQVIQLAKGFYPSPSEWRRGDPLELARSFRPGRQSFYVSAGFYDPYALFEANEMFVALLKTHSALVEWRPQWGDHCTHDISSISNFLAER